MKVAILGNGLTSLTLAKLLVNQDITIDIFYSKKTKINNKIQTLGLSKTNIDFLKGHVLDIKKFLWDINKIEIFSENLRNEQILNFENNKNQLFSIIKNYDLYNHLLKNLNKSKFVKFKKESNYKNLINSDYKLIFNCDPNNFISKKYFYNKIEKDYRSKAYVTSIKHKKLINNHTASQVFTKKGPLAFLPMSPSETSVVYSIKGHNNIDLDYLIKKYNTKYKILKINKPIIFELKTSNLRSYYHKNIIAFGDMLHKLHPLAGQGFNMTLRDIKEIYKLISFKKKHGLDLDISISIDFEKNMKNKNYLFSSGIDFIYEFFNFENKMNNNALSKSVKILGKNKIAKNLFTKFADNGLSI